MRIEDRAAPGPILRKGGRGPRAWFDPRGRALGHRAFVLNRITALGLVFYLYLHLAVLSMLLRGEQAWNDFVRLAMTRGFVLLDILLLAGVLYHAMDGIRVALVGTGVQSDRQKSLWWSLMAVAGLLLLWGGLRMWSK